MARKSRTNPTSAADGGTTSTTKSKPKRIRRKCSAPNCTNRVVQGGVCVTHGAKRKLCSFPSCTKAVKLAGFCSTHGPARRKCDSPGCTRVAVQGGKCLSHGARRRVCCYPLGKMRGGSEKCTKNAIMGGMCKKHYDRVQEAEGMLEMSLCVPVASSGESASAGSPQASTDPVAMSVSGGSSSGIDESDAEGGMEGVGGGEDLMSLSGAPSWGSAITAATSGASTIATMGSVASEAPPAAPAAAAVMPPSSSSSHRRSKKSVKPSHQRGLSIFDEMLTVDAIIGSGAESQPADAAAEPTPQEPSPQVSSAVVAVPVALPPVPSVRYPQGSTATKTPTPQVSFADCVTNRPSNRGGQQGAVPSAPGASTSTAPPGESPCTGNASCTCNACRSPTLAIFEQMIQASQKLEKGDLDLAKYAGLSPPKLSPRKTSSSLRESSGSRTMRDVYPETTTPKNVSFLPEEPTSSGSVVRKVSSNNIVGEGGWEENASSAAAVNNNVGGVPQDDHPAAQGYQQGNEAPVQEEGPASHALAAMAARDDDASVSRTVSHDVDDGRYHHHYSSYYHHQHNHHHGAPPPPHYSHHPSYHRGPPPPPHYPQGGGYPSDYPQAPHPREGPPPPSYHGSSYHDQHGSYHHPPSASYHAFQPPQTPALYDVSTTPPQEQQEQPMAVVSAHSTHHHHHCDQHLLPKRRTEIQHLFIPKEV